MLILLVILAVVTQIAISIMMYFRRNGSSTNLIFMLLSIALAGWAATNYIAITVDQGPDTIYAIRTVLSFVVAQNLLFYLFAKHFPDKSLNSLSKFDRIFILLSVLVLITTQTPIIFESAVLVGETATPQPGVGIPIFMLHAVFAIFSGLFFLWKKFRKATGEKRSQLFLILVASSFLWLIAPITNFVITLALDTTIFVSLSPFYTLLFSIVITYAVVSARLFDIRAAVARSVGYVMSLLLIVAIYSLIAGFLSSRFIDTNSAFAQGVFHMFFALFTIVSFQRLNRFFDRYTNKIFFRDAYEPQEFLDQLNKSIVSNIEIGILLRHTTAIIEENIKSSFVQIVVPKTESTDGRIVGAKDPDYSEHELNYLRGRLVGLGRKIVAADDLGPEEDELRKIFNKHDIAALVHLAANSYGQSQTIAYMIFGNKKSGNIYSQADFKIIEIVADELVIAIQNALRFEEIQEFNVTLQNKVNTATNKLRKTNDKLKAMDETKDEFISMASHQLRTPLTSVKGYLSMVLEGDAGEINETQRKLLDQAFVSSQRMVYLIADLLNVSRLRTGKFIIDAHPANLADIVEGEVSQLKEQAKAKNIEMTLTKPDEFPQLLIDETKTRQVIMNFIDNALYYTQSGGRIDVSLSEDKGHVYFQVKDNGLGVPKDEQKHLFTKFYRAKNARNIRPDGTGLGLFMAKKVITAQGGNILFSSTENKGSTFGFSFNKKHLALDRPSEEIGQGNED